MGFVFESDIAELAFWKKCFRVLDGWEITYANPTKGQCTETDTDIKKAVIHAPSKRHDGFKTYILHEVLHVAIEAASVGGKKANETLVQDISGIVLALDGCGNRAKEGE